nr:hypothetical protein [Tanacetum cinerariifolium]
HHHRRIVDVARGMADHHRDALVAQPLHHIAFGNIGALYRVAEVLHHLGNAGHANPADADEVDRADVGCDPLHANAALVCALPTGSG